VTIRPASDRALLISFGEEISADVHRQVFQLTHALEGVPGILNLHPAFASVLVEFDPRAVVQPHRHPHEQMGMLLTMRGRPLEALTWLARGIRIDPLHPHWYQFDRALALYMMGDYKPAAEALELATRPKPWIRTRLAACYAQLGRMEEAKAAAAQALRLNPGFRLGTLSLSYRFDVDRERVLDGMRKAGLAD